MVHNTEQTNKCIVFGLKTIQLEPKANADVRVHMRACAISLTRQVLHHLLEGGFGSAPPLLTVPLFTALAEDGVCTHRHTEFTSDLHPRPLRPLRPLGAVRTSELCDERHQAVLLQQLLQLGLHVVVHVGL